MAKKEIIIKDSHRGLYYEDGKLVQVLEAGRYELPLHKKAGFHWFERQPETQVVLVDIRARELTIKGQEILTADKVAIRVNILVQFKVKDPKLAIQEVENFEDRLYSDVQLAARRSLASMKLEEILTNRNRLSEDILHDVQGPASAYGVQITRADVKDLGFPGNLQEIMNRVLAAERNSEAQLVEARTKAEVQKIEAETKVTAQKLQAETDAMVQLSQAKSKADAIRQTVQAELEALEERSKRAPIYQTHPALLRLEELATLRKLGKNANARLYIDFEARKVDEQE